MEKQAKDPENLQKRKSKRPKKYEGTLTRK